MKFKKTQEKNFKRFKMYPDFLGGHSGLVCKRLYIHVL